MAKKKKKNSKTLKALIILLAVVSSVCIGITLGTSAYKMKQEPEADRHSVTIGDSGNTSGEVQEQSNGNKKQEQDKSTKPTKKPEKQVEEQENKASEEEQTDKTNKPDELEEQSSSEGEGSDTGSTTAISEDISSLSNESYSWSWKRNKEHKRPVAYNKFDIKPYDAYYVMNTDEKVIYLTMDEGYENGYTPMILDTLKANDVQATFFVTKPFIKNNKELAKRMKDEGHIVGNHTVNHNKMPTLSDEVVKSEIMDTEVYFEEVTGYKMDKFFRPPAGEYSERTLAITQQLGYKTMFWSMAYADWDRNKQKGAEYALNHVLENAHPGMIPLLHAVSSSNAEALDDIIKKLKAQGYRFGNLYEVE